MPWCAVRNLLFSEPMKNELAGRLISLAYLHRSTKYCKTGDVIVIITFTCVYVIYPVSPASLCSFNAGTSQVFFFLSFV
jgi:hypothetical protein